MGIQVMQKGAKEEKLRDDLQSETDLLLQLEMDKMAEVSLALSKKMDVSLAPLSLTWGGPGEPWAPVG